MSGRVQQRQHSLAKLRDQTWQSAVARCVGGDRLASGAFPTQLSTGTQVERDTAQGSAGDKSGAQKSHRGGSTAIGGKSVENPNRTSRSGSLGTKLRKKENEFEGNRKETNRQDITTLERGRRARCLT